MGDRFVLIAGDSAAADGPGLARRCREWGGELGVEVELADVLPRGVLGAVVDAGAAALAEAMFDAGVPVVWADLSATERGSQPPPAGVLGTVRGRGIATYRWALRLLAQRLAWPPTTIRYGPGDQQVGDLRLPATADGSHPVAVLVHGGFWRERWERDTIEPLAIDLARRGYATWNLEYRRVGRSGGGWPATFDDVATGIDHLRALAREHPLDLERVVLVGHSAGGQLALWAAERRGARFGPPAVHPRLVVSLAGVLDLIVCAERGVGDTANAVVDFLGGWPNERPDVYAAASPAAGLPLAVPRLVVHGWRDSHADLVDLGRRYAASAAAAGDPVELLELDDDDHFSIIDPSSSGWQRVADRIDARLAGRAA